MATFGKWGDQTFTVNTYRIYRPLDITRKGAGKRNKITNLPEGRDSEKITLTLKVGAAVGCDVRGEIEWWMWKINTAENLIIGYARYGNSEMILDTVDVKDAVYSDSGVFLEAMLSLTFSAKPTWDEVYSALVEDAHERAKSAQDDRERYRIMNEELAAAVNAAINVYNWT